MSWKTAWQLRVAFRSIWLTKKVHKAAPIKPIDPEVFRLRLVKYLALQLFQLFVFWMIYSWAQNSPWNPVLLVSGLAFLLAITTIALLASQAVHQTVIGRLLDLHPDLPRKGRQLYQLLLVFPITAIPFISYLSITKNSRPSAISFLIKRPITLAAIATLIGFGPMTLMGVSLATGKRTAGINHISYWSSSVTMCFVSSLMNEVQVLKGVGQTIRSSQKSASLNWRMEQYAKDTSPTITGMTLMMAYEVRHAKEHQKRGREVARIQPTLAALDLLDGMTAIIELVDKSGARFLNINPIAMLSPSGLIEGGLLSVFFLLSKRQIDQKIRIEMQELFAKVEPEIKSPPLQARFRFLRERFESTALFRAPAHR